MLECLLFSPETSSLADLIQLLHAIVGITAIVSFFSHYALTINFIRKERFDSSVVYYDADRKCNKKHFLYGRINGRME